MFIYIFSIIQNVVQDNPKKKIHQSLNKLKLIEGDELERDIKLIENLLKEL